MITAPYIKTNMLIILLKVFLKKCYKSKEVDIVIPGLTFFFCNPHAEVHEKAIAQTIVFLIDNFAVLCNGLDADAQKHL